MSEYWVSKKKYFCKYCDIFIADDAPSRSQHENGLRHQGNKERYVRNLYKTAERNKKDDEEEKREMIRIEAAAAAAYSADVGAGHGPSSSTSKASAAPTYQPKPKPGKMGFSMSNYTSAADLGIVDEDAIKAAAEAAVRQNEGRIGAWEVVAPAPAAAAVAMPSLAELDRKRAPPADDEDDVKSFDVKRRKIAPGLLGDIYDPIIVNVRRKDAPKAEPEPEMNADAVPDAPRPGWAPVSWGKTSSATPKQGDEHAGARGDTPRTDSPISARPAEASAHADDASQSGAVVSDAPEQRVELPPPKVEEADALAPAPAEPTPSMFRKRKGPVSTATRGRRQI